MATIAAIGYSDWKGSENPAPRDPVFFASLVSDPHSLRNPNIALKSKRLRKWWLDRITFLNSTGNNLFGVFYIKKKKN